MLEDELEDGIKVRRDGSGGGWGGGCRGRVGRGRGEGGAV